MKAPAHIAFGYTFTGLFSSFLGVNILSNYAFLPIIFFASLLPDIDHPSSILGKSIPPLSKYISKHFGHRTLTHSFLFLFSFVLILKLICIAFLPDVPLTTVVFFAVLSHILLDMATIQGVPIFYPFLTNSCVVPGNPSYRFQTNNNSHEIMIFCFCIISSFFMKDLFTNGFWTTYNQTFSSINHLESEYIRTDKFLEVELVVKDYNSFATVKGHLIDIDGSDLIIVSDNSLIRLSKNEVFNSIAFAPSDITIEFRKLDLSNLNADQVLKDAVIQELSIVSDSEIIGMSTDKPFDTKALNLKYPTRLQFVSLPTNIIGFANVLSICH